MEARVKATGEIVDGNAMVSFQGDDFYLKELEAIQDNPDYWTRLEPLYDKLNSYTKEQLIRIIMGDNAYLNVKHYGN